MEAGWQDAPLALRDLAVSNLNDINYGRQPILLPWRFLGHQVPALTTHTSDSPLPVNPSPTPLHAGISKESLPILNNPPIYTSYIIPTPSISFILQETADAPHTKPCGVPPPSLLHTIFVAIRGI